MKRRGRKPGYKSQIYPHRYSVYDKRTDMPVAIYETPQRCAEAMGISVNSFYRYICRFRSGEHSFRDWEIHRETEAENE